MNDAEEHFRELLINAPFDDAYRSEHRDQVRELALRAFDEAAAEGPRTTLKLSGASRPAFTRRPAVRLAFAAAAAASVGAALIAWSGRSGEGTSPDGLSNPNAVTQSAVVARADQQLIAALDLLSDFDEGRDAAAFDQGVQVCMSERLSEIAALGQSSLGARDQSD